MANTKRNSKKTTGCGSKSQSSKSKTTKSCK